MVAAWQSYPPGIEICRNKTGSNHVIAIELSLPQMIKTPRLLITSPSELLNLQHIQPIQYHHRLDQIPPQVNMHPIILIRLNTHIIRPQMLHAPPTNLNPALRLKDPQRLVPLRQDPLIGLIRARSIRRQEQPRPEARVAFALVRCELGG